MKLGPEAMEALQKECDGFLTPDLDLVVCGAVALEGTQVILERENTHLRQYFSEGFLWKTAGMIRDSKAKTPVRDENTICVFSMGEGGFLSALWKLAEASGVGLSTDLRKVPIRQETIEICERFDLDPYRLLSEGAFLAGCRNGAQLAAEYLSENIPAQVIGRTNNRNDRLLKSGSITRYLDRPSLDEIGRISWGEEVLKSRTAEETCL